MNCPAFIAAIGDARRHAQAGAAGVVNRRLLFRNWQIDARQIDARLVEFAQPCEDRAEYGAGLPLRTDKNQTWVKNATGGLNPHLFVSRHPVALPKPEHLEQLIQTDRPAWEPVLSRSYTH